MRLTEKEHETLPIDVSGFYPYCSPSCCPSKDLPTLYPSFRFPVLPDCVADLIIVRHDLLRYCPHRWRVQRHGCVLGAEKQVSDFTLEWFHSLDGAIVCALCHRGKLTAHHLSIYSNITVNLYTSCPADANRLEIVLLSWSHAAPSSHSTKDTRECERIQNLVNTSHSLNVTLLMKLFP